MDKSIETIRATRTIFIDLMKDLSLEQLNRVPVGFNNNITWNFAHVVATQQILCYKLANLPFKIDQELVLKYAKGTKPMAFIDEAELFFWKQQAFGLLDELVLDLDKGIFSNYATYPTSFGVELTGIEDALKYVGMHEGLHLGYVMALKKIV